MSVIVESRIIGTFLDSGDTIPNSGVGIPGTPYLIPALWLGLSQSTERDSTLARPQSKSRIFALRKRWISSVMRPVVDQPQCYRGAFADYSVVTP